MEFWQQILILTLTPTAVVTAVTYLLQKLFESSLTRDLERFKSDLQTKQLEFQTRFSALHEKRIQVIGELYGLLVQAMQLAYDLVQPIQFADSVRTLPAKRNEAFDAMAELEKYFQSHRIYFDKSICEKMDSLINGTHESMSIFSLTHMKDTYERDETGMWVKAWEKMNNVVSPLKIELELQFRELIEPNAKAA